MNDVILGIDLGTSMVKAALFSKDGQCISVASRSSSPHNLGNGKVEQNFEEIVAAVGEVSKEACSGNADPKVIGITGQSDGLWLLDENGFGIRPAVSWLDDRGNPYLKDWINSGIFEAVFRKNANALFPGSHAPLMAALKDSDPESLSKAYTASYLKDGILQRLTGARVTDASDASLPFLDITKRDYDPDILKLLGLQDMRRLLSPVMSYPGECFKLNERGSKLTGLPVGTPVHAGPFDIVACAIGAGVKEVGDGLIIIGTTLACEVLTNEINTQCDPAGMTLCMPEPNLWLRTLPATVGTATLDWVLNLIGASHDDVESLLSESRTGANGVSALPYFSATGERAPFVDVNARGQLSGLNTATTKADLVMAVCESVAYAARHCIEAANLSGRLMVCGGGSNSSTWSQIIADVLQKPLYIAPKPEVGARGAAITAMKVAGIEHDLGKWTMAEGIIKPRTSTKVHYNFGYNRYLDLVASARDLWSKHAN